MGRLFINPYLGISPCIDGQVHNLDVIMPMVTRDRKTVTAGQTVTYELETNRTGFCALFLQAPLFSIHRLWAISSENGWAWNGNELVKHDYASGSDGIIPEILIYDNSGRLYLKVYNNTNITFTLFFQYFAHRCFWG